MAQTWTSSTFSTDNQYIKYRIRVTENSYSIENNTSNVTVTVDAWRTNTGYTTYGTGTCYCTIKGTKYSNSISTSQEITHNSHTVLFRRANMTIAHNQDGKYSLSVSAYINHQRFSSKSQGFTVALTAIPRQATITNTYNFTDEAETFRVEVNNPAGDAVEDLTACLSLDGVNPLGSWYAMSKAGGLYDFALTQAQKTALLQATPNANTLTAYVILKTTIGGIDYTDVQEITMTVVNANPTITGASYADVNSSTTNITGDPTKIIQGQSSVTFSFTTLTALKYATLASIAVTIQSATTTATLSGTSASNTQLAVGAINSANNINAVIVLTDSRGNTTALSLPVTMLAWYLPSAIISCERVNNYYSETDINVNGAIASLDGNNTMSISLKYKESTSATWSASIPLVDEQTYQVTLDNTKRWDIQIIVADRIGSVTYNLNVERGVPIAFFDRLLKAFGVEKLPKVANGIDADGSINSDTDVTAGQDIKATRDVTAGRNITATGDISAEDINASGNVSGDKVIASDELRATNDVIVAGCSCTNFFSETARAVGKWIDGNTIYERVFVLPQSATFATNSWVSIVGWSSDSRIVDVWGLNTLTGQGSCWKCFNAEISSGAIKVQNTRSVSVTADTFIIRFYNIPTS